MDCPLCHAVAAIFAELPPRRVYWRCGECDLVFADRQQLPMPDHEVKRYLEHNNVDGDAQYESFLRRLWDPIRPHLSEGATGLDYGSGPVPVLSSIIRRDGFQVEIYDPFFAPDMSVLSRKYDFVTCCETAEHFHRPGAEIQRLVSLLRPGGWLGLQTAMLGDWRDFPEWHYHRDDTHVSFYSHRTMEWIGNRYALRVEAIAPHVVLFQS